MPSEERSRSAILWFDRMRVAARETAPPPVMEDAGDGAFRWPCSPP